MRMKRTQKIIAVVLVAMLALSFVTSCGKKETDDNGSGTDNPLLGVWKATTVELFGDESDADELFDGGFIIDLKSGGKCEIRAEGKTDKYSWKMKGSTLVISAGKNEFLEATVDYPVMVIDDFMDMGMKITLVKEGAAIPGPKATDPEPTDPKPEVSGIRDMWEGVWYGYFWVPEAWGTTWEGWEDHYDDAFLTIEVDDNGVGTIEISVGEIDGNLVLADIDATEYHFEVTDGVFFDMELDPAIWWLALSPVNEGKVLVINDIYIDPDGGDTGGFDFMFYFRPWGELWDEEISEGEYTPPSYDEYIELLSEEGAPDDPDVEPTPSSPPEVDVEPFYTMANLERIYEEVSAAYDDFSLREMTYEDVRDEFFGGIEGRPKVYGSTTVYFWDAIDSDIAYISVDFQDIGKPEMRGVGVAKYIP